MQDGSTALNSMGNEFIFHILLATLLQKFLNALKSLKIISSIVLDFLFYILLDLGN